MATFPEPSELIIAEGVTDRDVICITRSHTPTARFTTHVFVPESTDHAEATVRKIYTEDIPDPRLGNLVVNSRPHWGRWIYVLISTKSGTGKAQAFFENVLKPVLSAVGINEGEYTVIKTEDSKTVTEFAGGILKERAREGSEQMVILLSGDGGVVDIINGLVDDDISVLKNYRRPVLSLFPLGTGNALFHSLIQRTYPPQHNYLPLRKPDDDLTIALRTLLFNDTPYPLPTFRASFSSGARILSNSSTTATPFPHNNNTLYGAIVASYGFHATLVADSDTETYRKHGAARFGMVARNLLTPQPHAYKAKVTLQKRRSRKDDVTEQEEDVTKHEDELVEQVLNRREHGYILLTLVSNLEKTFTISPDSKPRDGKLRIVHFGPEKADTVQRIMEKAYDGGKHTAEGMVSYEEVDGVRIEFLEGSGADEEGMEGRWRRVCIDGTIVRVEEGGWMEVSMNSTGDYGAVIDVLAYGP